MRSLLVLDYPGRRPEAHVSEMDLEGAGFETTYALTSPLPDALTTPAYADQLRQRLSRADAVIAYCAASPLAVAMTALQADPVPIVVLDPQQTPPSEIALEYHEVVRQVEGKAPLAERPALLDVEHLLASPDLLVKRVDGDLRLRARLALETYGIAVPEVGGPVDGVVGVYVEWLTFLIAAHHDEQPPPGGPVLQVISRGHPDDVGWLGATDLQTVRVDCERSRLAADPAARAAVLDFLRRRG